MITKTAERLETKGRWDKIIRMKKELVYRAPRVDTEGIKITLEVYEDPKNDYLPTIIKRAKVLEKKLLEKTIFIDDNPIVGCSTKYPGAAVPQPEWACRFMTKDVEFVSKRGKVEITEEDRQVMRKAVDYWGDRCIHSRAVEIFSQVYEGKVDPNKIAKAGVWSESLSVPTPEGVYDYPQTLSKGFKGIVEEIKQERAKLPVGNLESHSKRYFYDACLISLNAGIKFAHRYASLAREMARKEADPERKTELEIIAETCEWIPENPPRSFYEAIQFFQFIRTIGLIHCQQPGMVPQRLGQYLYPYYKKDKDGGNITEGEALELLGFLFLKLFEVEGSLQSKVYLSGNQGQTITHIVLGGYTPDGRDATNELEYLILETQRRLKLIQPTLSVLIHDKMPEDFLLKCVDVVVETGLGQPAFFSAPIAVQRLLHHYRSQGITLAEARDISMVGCIQTRVSGSTSFHWRGYFNMAKMLELALNNGKDPLTGFQVGPETGEAEQFRSYDELHQAVQKQLEYFLEKHSEFECIGHDLYEEIMPSCYGSALTNDCIKRGKDLWAGGARYSGDYTIFVATVDLGNSLAAIRQLVFEDKKITLKQLKQALETNFKGYEDIQRMCLNVPKFGNDDDYVDEIVRQWYEIIYEEYAKHPGNLGHPAIPEAFSVSAHNQLGLKTGALPSGRVARVPLTDASVSAMPGTDRKGPTALAKSAAKAIDTIKWGSNHLNMKFHPSALRPMEGRRKLLALIKSYMDLGGSMIQFNCVSNETLKDAQLHPEKYRDLVVRVAGFSAYFIHLDKELQDEIIRRSELRWETA